MISQIYIPLLIIFPLISGIIIYGFSTNPIFIRKCTTVISCIEVIYSLLFFIINSKPIWGFSADSLSTLMIILTTTIFFLSVFSAKLFIRKHHKYFYSLILILESILLGIFTTQNIFIFFVLWELELIPMYLLISLFGNKKARNSALKFVLYTFSGSLFLLLGILLCYFTNITLTGKATLELNLYNFSNVNILLQLIISVCFLIGFGVKIPIIPLHLWLADTHTNSSTPISMILAGVLLKLGLYGLIRFNISILPLSFSIIAPILSVLGIINIIYGAAIAYSQTNLKKLIAYSSISQMGLIILGLCTINKVGLIGSVYHMISHGIIAAGLFMSAGIIKLKFGTLNLRRLTGIANITPRLFGFTMLISLAAIGIPFLSGFIGEFLIIFGGIISPIISVKFITIGALSILLLSALYIMKLLHEVFFGTLPLNYYNVQDVAVHEFIILASSSAIIIIMGIFPAIFINFISVGG